MSDIVLSSAIRTNVDQLRQTAQLIAVVQKRLATGKKVNSALDNPAAFFAAQQLSSRASSLGPVLDGIARLEEVLVARGFHAEAGRVNEIPDSVIQRGLS